MGEEFCKGCRDCTNNNEEEDFSKQANPPLTNLNNPFFLNNKTNNSINDISQQNNESFLNNYNHKNESYTTTNNSRIPLGELEDNKNYKLKTNNNINGDESDIDRERLNEIKKEIYSKKIQNAFRRYKEEINNSHQSLIKEYTSIPSSEYILDLNNNDLDVDLAPEVNCLYLGTKFRNEKDGLGLEIFNNTNSKYFGIFKKGKRIEVGQFATNNDFKEYYYNGQVKGIYATGYGLFKDSRNNIYYEGMWKNSMRNGYGIEIYEDKSEYRGTFLNGKKNGIGYYRWIDGSSYEGEWKDNKLNGYGIYNFKDGSIYIGEWKGNRMSGLGQFSFPGVKSYIGYFNRDSRAGFGMVIWHKENKAFVGFWKNNQQDGIGKFFANNKIRYGIWKDGELIEKIHNSNDFYNRLNNEKIPYSSFLRIEEYENVRQVINKYIQY